MQPVSAEGRLQMFVKKSFTDKVGTTVEYFEAYFLCVDEDDSESVLKVNTKLDLTSQIGKAGTIRLSVTNGKLSLKSFASNG
jgi:hypothetical protein